MSFEPEAGSRGLRDHVGVLRRRWLIILAITLAAVIAALGWSLTQSKRYTASTQVLFQQETSTVADPRPDQIVDSKRLDPVRVMQNEVRLASSEVVRDRARQNSGVGVGGSVTNPRDSDILVISATAPTADGAAAAANAWAAAYVQVRQELSDTKASASLDAITTELTAIDNRVAQIDAQVAAGGTTSEQDAALQAERAALVDQRAAWVRQQAVLQADGALSNANQAKVIDPANAPSRPSQPATARNVVLALLLGGLLGLAVAYAVDQLDDVVRSAEDLERALTLPVLGTTSAFPAGDGVRAVPVGDPTFESTRLAPSGAAATPPLGGQVLLVPQGTRAREARHGAAVLDRLGVHLVGSVLLVPAGATPDPPVAPATSDEPTETERLRS